MRNKKNAENNPNPKLKNKYTYTEKKEKRTPKSNEVYAGERALNRVNFDTIHSLLSKIGNKSGIETSKLNLLTRKDVSVQSDTGASGERAHFDIRDNSIRIFPTSIVLDYAVHAGVIQIQENEEGDTKYSFLKDPLTAMGNERFHLDTLHTTIHELIHAISARSISIQKKEGDEVVVPESINPSRKKQTTANDFMDNSLFETLKPTVESAQTGYQLIQKTQEAGKTNQAEQYKKTFMAFDEGVTEIIAREVFNQYTKTECDDIPNEIIEQHKTRQENIYRTSIEIVDAVIDAIAKNSGLDKQTVWNAIVRSKLEGVDLLETEMAQFIDESTFEGFTEQLKDAIPGQPLTQSLKDQLANN